MSLDQTNTIYNHLFTTQLAWLDNGCIFNSIENKCNKNQNQINDIREAPDCNSFIMALINAERIGVG